MQAAEESVAYEMAATARAVKIQQAGVRYLFTLILPLCFQPPSTASLLLSDCLSAASLLPLCCLSDCLYAAYLLPLLLPICCSV